MSLSGEIQKLAQVLRTESGRIELDQVIFHPPAGGDVPIALPAAIEVGEGHLHLDLRIPTGAQFPVSLEPLTQLGGGGPRLVTTADCYRITARTASGVAVELENVHPSPRVTNSATHFRRCRIGFSRLTLPAESIDAMDMPEIRAMLDTLPASTAPAETPLPVPQLVVHDVEEQLCAIIPKVGLRILNDGTDTTVRHPFCGELRSSKANCFVGQVDCGTFCLHEDEAGDLVVYFRRAIDHSGARHDTAQVFDGILAAIGYIHGCHPWPFYREHRRDHRVIERWVKPPEDCQRHGLRPMHDGHLSFSPDARRLFVTVAEFFAADTQAAQRHSRAQWLLREASPRHLAFELRLMALCVLFEGLMRDLEARYLTAEEQEPHTRGGLVRREKWRHALERHGLPWGDAFERVYESWNFYRSPLAHGFQSRTNDNAGTTFNAYSRLMAALHILLAREAGYTGQIAKSILEGNEVIVIPATPPAVTAPAGLISDQTD